VTSAALPEADASLVDVDASLLEVTDLTTLFRSGEGFVHAVDGVSLSLGRGETLGVVGESGSGKSVLARSIMRLLPRTALTAGGINFNGQDLTAMSPRSARAIWGRQIAMVFQDPMTSLNPVMRIGRQITESLHLHLGLGATQARSRAVELLGMVGLPEPARRYRAYPHELSGGLRQRVCIAIAIACSPRMLIADEPTTALDVTIQRQILDLLAELQRDTRMAMVLITHDLGVIAGRTGRVIVMYRGRIVEAGPTLSLFRRALHPYTAALLAAIPRIERPSHSRLEVIPGQSTEALDPAPGCRFAARCARAEPCCRREDPPLSALIDQPDHSCICFFPNGDPVRVTAEASTVRTQASHPLAWPAAEGGPTNGR
jgi:peptide/nickel transport system ATP-binding protein